MGVGNGASRTCRLVKKGEQTEQTPLRWPRNAGFQGQGGPKTGDLGSATWLPWVPERKPPPAGGVAGGVAQAQFETASNSTSNFSVA